MVLFSSTNPTPNGLVLDVTLKCLLVMDDTDIKISIFPILASLLLVSILTISIGL